MIKNCLIVIIIFLLVMLCFKIFLNQQEKFQAATTIALTPEDNFKDWINRLLRIDDTTRCRLENRLENENIKFAEDVFRINVIPGDKEINIYWEEKLTNVKEYIILLYNVDNPDIVKTETVPYTIQPNNLFQHRINVPNNNVMYSVTLNKLSINNNAVVASNTVRVVPSIVTLLNFSQINRNNTLVQNRLRQHRIMDELQGTTFNLTM